MQFIGRSHIGIDRGDGRCGRHLGICAWVRSGLQALPGLLCVATEGLVRCGAILAGVMVSETRPGEVVSGFYGG